jgi:hypothetical protein
VVGKGSESMLGDGPPSVGGESSSPFGFSIELTGPPLGGPSGDLSDDDSVGPRGGSVVASELGMGFAGCGCRRIRGKAIVNDTSTTATRSPANTNGHHRRRGVNGQFVVPVGGQEKSPLPVVSF